MTNDIISFLGDARDTEYARKSVKLARDKFNKGERLSNEEAYRLGQHEKGRQKSKNISYEKGLKNLKSNPEHTWKDIKSYEKDSKEKGKKFDERVKGVQDRRKVDGNKRWRPDTRTVPESNLQDRLKDFKIEKEKAAKRADEEAKAERARKRREKREAEIQAQKELEARKARKAKNRRTTRATVIGAGGGALAGVGVANIRSRKLRARLEALRSEKRVKGSLSNTKMEEVKSLEKRISRMNRVSATIGAVTGAAAGGIGSRYYSDTSY